MIEEDSYSCEVTCKNCKKINYFFKIQKGTTIASHLEQQEAKCEKCGCSLD